MALSPFRMASIHHSPLPTRQKDHHTFSVSVSDSLPPHVMELDSPEHCGGDHIDEAEDSAGKDKQGMTIRVSDFERECCGRKRVRGIKRR